MQALPATQRELLEQAERLRSAYASMDDLIFILDRDGIFIDFFQPSLRPELLLPPEQFLGKSYNDVMPSRITKPFKEALDRAIKTGQVQQFDYSLEMGMRELWFNAKVTLRWGMDDEIVGSSIVVRNITDKALAETALRKSESSLRFAQRVGRMGSWEWNLSNNSFTLSEEMIRLMDLDGDTSTEYSMESLLEKSVHPDDRERVAAASAQTSIDPEKAPPLVYRIIRSDGEVRWVTATAPRVRRLDKNGNLEVVIGVVQDITEQKEAEDILRIHSQALQQSFDGIVRIDMEGNFLFVNAAWAAMHNRTVDEFEGKHLSICHNKEQLRDEVIPIIDAARDGEGRICEMHHIRKDGSVFPTQISGIVIRDDQGTPVGMMAIARDLTREKELERRLRHSQKMEAIGTLAGGIAHDFNNLLYIIQGNTELAILNAPEGSEVLDFLKEIRSAGDRATNLVRQILDFSRQGETVTRPVRLQPVLEEALSFLRATLPKTIEIRSTIDPHCGMVLIEESRFHQVIVNLGANALQAMRERGGLLEISLSRISIPENLMEEFADLDPGDYAHLVVRDTGHGMTESVRERIFEPYFSTGKGSKGTGLGLSTVHGVVMACGGAIAVKSEVGEGSEFDILLPTCAAREAEESDGDVEGEGGLEGTERILFVDDEEQIARWGRIVLGRAGYHVEAHTDSVGALEAFRKDPDAFDVVVTDQTMPNLTGIELADKILHIRPGLPIVLCTGYSDVAGEDKVLAAGVKEYVKKPAGYGDLIQAIKRAIIA